MPAFVSVIVVVAAAVVSSPASIFAFLTLSDTLVQVFSASRFAVIASMRLDVVFSASSAVASWYFSLSSCAPFSVSSRFNLQASVCFAHSLSFSSAAFSSFSQLANAFCNESERTANRST